MISMFSVARWTGVSRAFGLAVLSCGLSGELEAAPFKLIVTETTTPVIPNSVMDLALPLGYYKKAGVDVELVRVQQTPSAVAALRAGEGDMANISFDTALQLVARDQMKLKGVISPDKALPFIIAVKKDIATPKQLEGRTFGVGRVGSLDYNLSRIVLSKLGVNADKLQYVALGQPPVRAQSLAGGRVDATTVSIGVWESLPDKSGLSMLVSQAAYYKAAPLVSKVNVVTEETAKGKAAAITGVVRDIILASRDFARNPALWVDALAKARPDVPRATLEFLAHSYKESWSVNGGLALTDIKFTTESLYEGKEFEGLRKVGPREWIQTSFVDAVLKSEGTAPGADAPDR